jgi:hypothetical protein
MDKPQRNCLKIGYSQTPKADLGKNKTSFVRFNEGGKMRSISRSVIMIY